LKSNPHRWGWKVFEAPGEIRIFDSTGALERIIPFNEADRRL
jgi:hypothetical protein